MNRDMLMFDDFGLDGSREEEIKWQYDHIDEIFKKEKPTRKLVPGLSIIRKIPVKADFQKGIILKYADETETSAYVLADDFEHVFLVNLSDFEFGGLNFSTYLKVMKQFIQAKGIQNGI